MSATDDVARWLATADPWTFPYNAVVDEYQRHGKHFVAPDLLMALDTVRVALAESANPGGPARLLSAFLWGALDKWDSRYDYPSYLGLGVLPLPDIAGGEPAECAERRYDRLIVALVGDAMRFELLSLSGRTGLLPEQRPHRDVVAKRCRLGLRVIAPAAARLALGDLDPSDDPMGQAERLWAAVSDRMSEVEHRALRLSMLPVDVVHDEYQFIRVLQSFEATFALMAVELSTAREALQLDGGAARAQRSLTMAETALHQAAPLFSLLATMSVESFRTFRTNTDGASAIQSCNYKIAESVCRTPDQERLDSLAYQSVPDVRARVLAGEATLDEVFALGRAEGRLTAAEHEAVGQAMQRFANTMRHWRQTHYRIAVRMLGDSAGTGATSGTPYLEAVRTIAVFRSDPTGWPGCPFAAASDGGGASVNLSAGVPV